VSSLLWYGDGDDDAIDLGDPITMWHAFASLGRVLEHDPDYDELQSVPGFAEQLVTAWWLNQVARQARMALAAHEDELPEPTLSLLRLLVEECPGAARSAKE
jgi:hypothetical protein